MMISEQMNAELNEQVAAEFSAAHQYLAMSCAFGQMGLKFLSKRFSGQHAEELGHAIKIIKYVQEVGGRVVLDAVARPAGEFESVESIVAAALDGEVMITKKVNELVALAERENDYATRSFLQWFVDEQVEEVSSMTELLQLVKLAGDNVLQVEARVRHEMVAGG